ncbi:hypothetical protein OROHE_026596 [Orobanche hederae]
MAGWFSILPMLRDAADSSNWEDVLILYTSRALNGDLMLQYRLNSLAEVLLNGIQERELFIFELYFEPRSFYIDKMLQLLSDTQVKDEETLQQLRNAASNAGARAYEKHIFIEKLKGNLPW